MLKHRDRRATPPGGKSGPPLRGRPCKPAGSAGRHVPRTWLKPSGGRFHLRARRLLARSSGYSTALRSSSAGSHGRSRSSIQSSTDPNCGAQRKGLAKPASGEPFS